MSLIRGKLKSFKDMLRYMEKLEENGNIKPEHGVSILRLFGTLFLSGFSSTLLAAAYLGNDLTGLSVIVMIILISVTFIFGGLSAYHGHKMMKGVHKDDKK